VVDGLAGGIDVVSHLIDHVVDGDSVDQLTSAIHRGSETALGARSGPAGAFHRAFPGPARTFQSAIAGPLRSPEPRQSGQRRAATGVADHGANWPTSRRSAPEKQRHSCTNSGTNQSCRQQVILLLTILVQFHLWVGRAGAVFPNRRLALR